MGYKKKVDISQAPMVEELRKCGMQVILLHMVGEDVPDLLVVGYSIRHGLVMSLLVEAKTPGKGKLTDGQKEFIKKMEDKFPGMDIPLIVAEESKSVLQWFGKA
jgi:hypothetical protein